MTERRCSDAGVATVAAGLALAALLTVTVLICQAGTVVVARHRAQSAADLGALAAATALTTGADACTRAREIAEPAGARVRTCTVEGWDVTVAVESSVRIALPGFRVVRAVARAGPGDTDNSS